MAFSKCPLEGWIFGAQRAKMRSPCNSKTKSQKREPNWLLKYLIIPNFCAKCQPNRLTTTLLASGTLSRRFNCRKTDLEILRKFVRSIHLSTLQNFDQSVASLVLERDQKRDLACVQTLPPLQKKRGRERSMNCRR